MKLEDRTMPAASLLDAPNNPNRMEPDKMSMLAEAIRREGFLQPILVRPTHPTSAMRDKGSGEGGYEIIDGHHRRAAALEAGLHEIPCIIAHDCDEHTAIALRIGMNRLRGDLDLTSTAKLVSTLVENGWKLDDLSITGFSADEVADLMRSLKTEDVEIRVFDDAMEDGDGDAPVAKPFALEIIFKTRDELKRAKKALKKAAGKNGDYGKGLLRLMGE